MLIGVYGLNGDPPTLTHEFPEYELDESQLESVTYRYSDAVQVNKPVDHITCHADGRIHVRTRTADLYVHTVKHTEPLGQNTATFLRFMLFSDIARKYAAIPVAPKQPWVGVKGTEEGVWLMQGSFSGSHYSLEVEVAATIAHLAGGAAVLQPGVALQSGTLKGVLWGHSKTLPAEALAKRPTGSIVSFKFPAAGGKWLIKTFVFA